MRRTLNGIAFAVLMGSFSGTADADWPTHTHQMHIDIARNNTWPQPFRGMDANAVLAPFEIMKNNGWRDNNTIGGMMFSEAGLTEAGKLKVATVVTNSPSNRRSIFVQAGQSQEETALRIESVQVAVSQLVPSGPLPEILVTHASPSASPGAYQTAVHRAIQRTTPIPRLPRYTGLNTPGAAIGVAGEGK